MKNRHHDILKDFNEYCANHPEERFWQALRNWSGWSFILVANAKRPVGKIDWQDPEDTFYWEGRDSMNP